MTSPPAPRLWHQGEGEALWFLGNFLTVKVGGAQSRGQLTVIDFVNPPGFAPPLHRHEHEEEVFYVLEGAATFLCDGQEIAAAPGDLVHLPAGLPHTFIVDAAAPQRVLQITTPAGFEDFAREAGEPAGALGLPPGPPTEAQIGALMGIAPKYDMEILGPPPA
jgi:quercetin dioxygenase-like cupin family protein